MVFNIVWPRERARSLFDFLRCTEYHCFSDKFFADLLAYLHHRFVWIHPFNNGNGRTARLLLNAAAMIKGFEPIQLYHREGEARVKYIDALRLADGGDIEVLTALILRELTPF
ncbi:MAG: Fic family protein [Dyadobacter sp.]|uniref:Fic family protein n=1 Tax=Dyadobacter sp. TaxID=1914288 RepID=UPI001B010551|nr:Fic family protein [Dyadobacter sp.]